MKKKITLWALVLFAACMLIQPIKADAAWKKTDNGSYSYYEKGKKLKNRWVGNYYVDKKGIMVTNQWVRKYFVGEDGKWIPNFKGGWQKINKKWYFYTKQGTKKTGWLTYKKKKYYLNPATGIMAKKWKTIKGSRYYFNKQDGQRCQGWQKIGGKTYYFHPQNGKLTKGLVNINKKIYCLSSQTGEMQTGFQNINNAVYYFNPQEGSKKGIRLTGWQTIKNKKYYFDKTTGVMQKGLHNISDYTYYFNAKGIMQKNTAVTVNGYVYNIDYLGRCTIQVNVDDPEVSDKMLFFTKFESGSAGYAQTGGDNGNACGYYQFDYRYSLLPFVKYCYSSDPVLFAEFKPYAAYTSGTKLKGNKKFFKAWKTIYNRSPKGFASYQDAYAKKEYYDETARYLSIKGITLNGRSDIVKGAVFSYSIQHGQYSAALAVEASKAYKYADKVFINKLYDYRIKKFPLYKSRYIQEKALALSLL